MPGPPLAAARRRRRWQTCNLFPFTLSLSPFARSRWPLERGARRLFQPAKPIPENTMQTAANPLPELNDPALLRNLAYIDGAWCAAASAATFDVTNPANGGVIASVPDMGADDARRAIDAAEAAFPAWSARTGKERAAIMRNWVNLLKQHAAELATLMTAEQGKPLAEAKGEVAYGASFVEWFAEEAKRVSGDVPGST